MKSLAIAVLIAAGGASAAAAATALPSPISSVTVSVGPALQAKASQYGQRELDDLTIDLERDVQQALDRAGSAGPNGASLQLVIADATPNRPTYKELGDRPGLSMRSFGIGGARIEGALVYSDGHSEPVRYQWYESDIRNARGDGTWSDADATFQQFADQVAHGKLYASR